MNSQSSGFRHQPLVRFLASVRPQMRLVIGAALMGIGKFTLPLAFPFAFKYVVDMLLAAHPTPDRIDRLIDGWAAHGAVLAGLGATAQGKLAVLSIAMLALYIVQSIASYYRNYWAGVAGNRLIFNLRSQLFGHMQRLSHSYFDQHTVGAIVSRVLNDVAQANELVSSTLIDVWMDAVSLGLVVFSLIELNWKLALISLCIAPLWVTFMRYFAPRIKQVSHRMQEAMELMTGEVAERIVGAATVKSFGREEQEIAQFNARSEFLYERTITKVKFAAAQEMLIQLLTRCAPAIVIWAGAVMIMRGEMTLGTLMAFFTLLMFVYLPLERFAQLSIIVSASTAAIERIYTFLDMKPEIADHPLSRAFAVKRGAVEFDGVRFAYTPREGAEPREVLKGIDLRVAGGSRVALVGLSGAGKTTLANLVPRFYDVSAGRVTIDGHDVRHFTLKSLRENISLVSQDALLFSASVRENLLYARPDATDEMMWTALKMASLDGFVSRLPEQLDTVIGERGVKVSGGQRQRLALARAFLKDSRIVILDEATSAVDSEAENVIHDAMERLMYDRTVFLIAHRLRSALTADQIVVLEDGKVAETGTHAELLRRNGVYARLYNEQTRGLMAAQAAQDDEDLARA